MNSWALTDKGIVRKQNQDAYYAFCDNDAKLAVLVVCDGMGGAQAGNVASDLTVKIFTSETRKELYAGITPNDIEIAMRKILREANAAVFELANSSIEYSGMGTTIVSCAVTGDEAVVLNVGDSRGYIITEGTIRQITKDHSVVEDMIDRGDITREESKTHPQKNLITRAVGTVRDIECDFFHEKLNSGDYLILCSDGLTNTVTDEEILKETINAYSLENACENLMRLSVVRGAPDNVTIVIFKK